MPNPRRIACLCAAAVVGGGAVDPAAADSSLNSVTTVTAGYTDNVQAVPDNPQDPSVAGRNVTSDAFTNIAPGLIFAHHGPRWTQVLRYTLSLRLYVEQTSGNSYSNLVEYGAIFSPSPRGEIGLEANASHGRLNAFNTAPEETPIQTQSRGDVAFVRAGVGASYAYQMTRSWRIREALGASIFQPTEETIQSRTRYSLDETLTLTKEFLHHAFSLTGRASYIAFADGEDAGGMELQGQRNILTGGSLRWVWDLNREFSTDLSAGATMTVDASNYERGEVLPIGAALLRFTRDRYSALAGYRHTVASNLLVAELQRLHVVEARGTVPMPTRDDMSLSGAVGYGNGRTLEEDGQTEIGNSQQWIGDISVAWKISDELTGALRYHYVRQTRDRYDFGIVNERTRLQQILVLVEGRYPTRQAAEIERDNSGRVDAGLDDKVTREEGRFEREGR